MYGSLREFHSKYAEYGEFVHKISITNVLLQDWIYSIGQVHDPYKIFFAYLTFNAFIYEFSFVLCESAKFNIQWRFGAVGSNVGQIKEVLYAGPG